MAFMNASFTLTSAVELLKQHHLLREIITPERWTVNAAGLPGADTPIPAITYDTRDVTPGSLLFVKGRFKPEFMDGIDERGLAVYISETEFSDRTSAVGLIVEDAPKAMALLSFEFYGRPDRQLKMVGITGTKGKTTTNYFTHAILNAYSHGRAAITSSIACCLDGSTWIPSKLTTPVSLDLARMMREAVDNGMEYFVMEVSSQAYKVNRVYDLTFDAGAFLNISPDHISPIEHPTFEDYLHCKRQIIVHSRRFVLGADCDHADLLREDAAANNVPVFSFALHDEAAGERTPADLAVSPTEGTKTGITVSCDGETRAFTLDMLGEFNFLNAAAAIALAVNIGVPFDSDAMKAIESVQVPGHMERFTGGENLLVFVDFAHNYLSTKALVDEMVRVYGERDPHITVVAGSTGGKAIDRREGIVKGALGRAESYIFTTDDPNFEDPQAICEQMASYVTDDARTQIIVDRDQAITTAIGEAREHADRFNIVLVIGKGHERRNIINGKAVPWPGDATIVRRELDARPAGL